MKYILIILWTLISIVGCDLPLPKQTEDQHPGQSISNGSYNDTTSTKEVNTDFTSELASQDTEIVDSLLSLPVLSDSTLVHALILDFDSCSYYAAAMLKNDGELLEQNRHSGNHFYNQAYNRVLQADQNALVGNEKIIVSSALSFYAEIFNNHDVGSGFLSDLAYQTAQVHSLLKPPAPSDKSDNRFIVNIDYLYKQNIRLPSKGNWCLWEMIGGQRIWIEGDLGGENGFGRFDIRADKLPIYLGNSKDFTITNAADEPGQFVQLIFQPCERN